VSAPAVASMESRELRKSFPIDWLSVLSVLVAALAWEFFSRTGVFSTTLIPPPSTVLIKLWSLINADWFPPHLWTTVTETVAGFVLGAVIAIPLGVLLGLSRFWRGVAEPYVVGFQVLPKIMLIPLFIAWFGFGLAPKIITAAAIGFFPVLVNTMLGMSRDLDDELDLMRSLKASKAQIFWKLRWRSALPLVGAGLETSITVAYLGAIVAEFVNAQEGLGVLVSTFTHQYQLASAFAVLIIMAIVGSTLYGLLRVTTRRLIFWR